VADDRIVTAARVDEEAQYEAGLRPRALDEYIGQDRIRENLQVSIAAARDAAPPALRDDVLSALINLGYHRPLAEKAVESAVGATPDGGFERTLRQALRELAK